MISPRRTFVIGIDGRSGTGKSTLAATLAHSLGAAVIGLDDLYRGWDGLTEAPPRLLHGVLEPLAAGRVARYRPYDWSAGDYSSQWREVGRPAVLVVEGVGALSRSVRPHLDVGIWLEAETHTRYERAMARDGDTFAPHWHRWAAHEDAYLLADDPVARADVVVRG